VACGGFEPEPRIIQSAFKHKGNPAITAELHLEALTNNNRTPQLPSPVLVSFNRSSNHTPAAMATQSLSSLLQRASIDDHEEMLSSANAALAKSKSDINAQHVKVVALLKLDRYEDCLRVFEESGDALKKKAALEYAYALYKHGQPDEAINVVSLLARGRGANHLEAQAVCPFSFSFRALENSASGRDAAYNGLHFI
jgi:hypothetical protein